MALALLWSPGARDDLVRLHDFLADKEPAAAQRAVQRILQAAAAITAVPEIGRPADDLADFRDFGIHFGAGAYILRYRLLGRKAALVLRVWHSREEHE